jgi:flagellar biosynthesis GTPase FlhF
VEAVKTDIHVKPLEIHDETAGVAEKTGRRTNRPDAEATDAAPEITDRTAETEDTSEKATDRMPESRMPMDEAAAEPEANVEEAAQRTAERSETAPGTTTRTAEPDKAITDQDPVSDQAPVSTPGEAEIVGKDPDIPAGLQVDAAKIQTAVNRTVSPQPDGSEYTKHIATADELATPPVPVEPAPTLSPAPSPTPFVFEESRILPEYKALYRRTGSGRLAENRRHLGGLPGASAADENTT